LHSSHTSSPRLFSQRKNRQNDQAAAKEKLERAKQDAQRLHDAEVNRLQEEHEEAIRNVREQLREEHSKEIARVKEDVSENASQEMDTRLGIVRSKLHELGRRESRLLAQIDTLRTQVTDAKHYANEEFKKRSELEGSLREAADVFKRELFAKNEQLQQLQREVNHLREWYVKGMEVVASDVHHLRSTNPSCLSEKAQSPGQAIPQKEAATGSK
jgi:chromosome segregation ATPase